MTLYYIEYGTTQERKLFSFDSTTEMRLSESGSATSYRVENGRSTSDHYTNNNVTISFSGRISDIKSLRRQSDVNNSYATTQKFITDLRALKQSGTPFKVYAGGNVGALNNCVFESLDISQDLRNGTRVATDNREVSAFRLTFTAVQIRFGARAEAVAQPASLIEKTVQEETPASSQTKEKTDKVFVRYGNTIYTREQYETMVSNSTVKLPDVDTLPVIRRR